jgi:hypothetical protein
MVLKGGYFAPGKQWGITDIWVKQEPVRANQSIDQIVFIKKLSEKLLKENLALLNYKVSELCKNRNGCLIFDLLTKIM